MATRDDLVAALMGDPSAQAMLLDPRRQRLAQQLLSVPDVSAPPVPEASSYDPSLRERMGNWIYDAMAGAGMPSQAEHTRAVATGGADFVPGLGNALTGQEAGRAFGEGNYGEGAGLLGAALVPIPAAGKAAVKGGKKLAKVLAGAAPETAAPAIKSLAEMVTGSPVAEALPIIRGRHTYPRAPLGGLNVDDHPGMVSPSVTSTRDAVVNSKERYIPTTLDTMRQHPDFFKKNMELMRNREDYPWLLPSQVSGDPESIARHAIAEVADNLGYYTSRAKPKDWEGLRWYQSANENENALADLHNFNDASVGAATAAISPQANWNINTHLGKQIVDRFAAKDSLEWDDNVERVAKRLLAKEEATRVKRLAETPPRIYNSDIVPLIQGIPGVPGTGVWRKPLGAITDPAEMGMWIRMHEEGWGDPLQPLVPGTPHLPKDHPDFIIPGDISGERGHGFRIFNPNGTFGDYALNKDGSQVQSTWNTSGNVGNSVAALLANGDRELIADALGGRHKVPSFHNNKLYPQSLMGDVTMDSHALAGAAMDPKAKAKEHGLATGTKNSKPFGFFGTYPLFADAYRSAAKTISKARDQLILPSQLQSVTWEMHRKQFENVSKQDLADIKAKWRDYNEKRITKRQAQDGVWDIGEKANERDAAERSGK